jgi:hypothetical protein
LAAAVSEGSSGGVLRPSGVVSGREDVDEGALAAVALLL